SVRSVGIYVGDQDRAKQFFTEVLGFDLIQDTPMGAEPDSPRWIEVAPPDKNVLLVLYTTDDQKDRVGTFSNVLFDCDDIEKTYDEMRAKGVEFTEAPVKQFWGWWAVFKDPDGNTYGIGQRGE
ncbi:MAG TPA: VOC family protein, partial [Herpetosiphonaceae bacterium]|nr:VOC family protein [Herpetosiphonaceae bacterium]